MTQTLLFILVILIGLYYAKKYGNIASEKITSYNKNKEDDSMLFWEDDYLMIEIMSSKNLKYAENEIGRISDFSRKQFNDNGFSNITEIKTKSVDTKSLKISYNEFIELMNSLEIAQYKSLNYVGIGDVKIIKNSKTKAFGSNSSAIFFDGDNNIIHNIWFSTYDLKNISKTKILEGLLAIGKKYDLIMVDFSEEQIIDLKNKTEIEKFLVD